MTQTSERTTVDPAAVQGVIDRVLTDLAATAGLQMIQLGIRTGLWAAMADAGPLTVPEVSARSGVAEPYAREWLRHQAVSGYVEHDPTTDRFSLPPATAAFLADESGARLVDGYAIMLGTMWGDQPLVEEAFRSGRGVGWNGRGAAHWHGMDLVTRATVVPALASQWLPALDGVVDRLRRGGRVADIGCGYGAVAVSIAEAYPASRVLGFDYHDASIARARKAAAAAGVSDRTAFEVAEAARFPARDLDLVVFVDTFHDLPDPVGVLRHARQALAPGGTVLLVEFAAGDRLQDNANSFGRMLYAASAQVCTPNAVSQGETEPLGTGPGPARLTALARRAGFGSVRRVEVEAPMNLLLELRP